MTMPKSSQTEVSQTELDLLNALRNSPLPTEQLTKIFNSFKQELNSGIDAYEAELQVVEATRILGKLLIEQWAIQTEKDQSDLSLKNKDLTKHGKKYGSSHAAHDGSLFIRDLGNEDNS